MDTLHRLKRNGDTHGRGKMLRSLVFTVFAVAGCLNQAVAQHSSFSDWNVPPPVSPAPTGNQVKGNANNKNTNVKPIALTLIDVPAPVLPPAPAIQMPVLAAVGTTPPEVNRPNQPVISNAGAGLAELPVPDAPDAPSIPKQVPTDALIAAGSEMPLPEAPEMPPSPKEPVTVVTGPVYKGAIPLMPNVIDLPVFSLPVNVNINIWPTPVIRQNESPQLIKPAGSKSIRPHNKGAVKAKQNKRAS